MRLCQNFHTLNLNGLAIDTFTTACVLLLNLRSFIIFRPQLRLQCNFHSVTVLINQLDFMLREKFTYRVEGFGLERMARKTLNIYSAIVGDRSFKYNSSIAR